MCADCEVALYLLIGIAVKLWCKKWFQKRRVLGHSDLLKEIKATSSPDFHNFVRMNNNLFEELLVLVDPLIRKQDTLLRESISSRLRLSLTLRYLASGNTFEDMKFLTAIAPYTISLIVLETCEAIIEVLKGYIKLPANEEEWKAEANAFNSQWNFPHCIGTIDGKHISITKPPGTGSYYYNYKKFFSIVLMAVVNANYEFLMVDVGTNGRASDAGVFNNTQFFSLLQDSKLRIPDPEPLEGFNVPMPFVFVSDDAFPLLENIMKPYSHRSQHKEEIIFNYRLSRARGKVENAFGILASRFRILLRTINLSPEKVSTIALACCYLHNYLRRNNDQTYLRGAFNADIIDSPQNIAADWQTDIIGLNSLDRATVRNPTTNAKTIRTHFCEYFNTMGAVPWQEGVYERLTNK